MDKRILHFLQLGLAMVVMSSSGALGRYIHLAPEITIWARCVIGSMALFLVMKLINIPTFIGWGKVFWWVALSALFLGLHWVTYFYSLQFTSVAIGMLSLFTYPVITALLEPWMLGYKHKLSDVLVAILAFSGVFFLVPSYNLENDVTVGVVLGIVSAIFYSVRNIMLKKNISKHSGITLMYYQLIVLSIIMLPILFIGDFNHNVSGLNEDWKPLLILGLFTTATAHTLFVMSFRFFSITTISIISSLTPLFGIVIGYFALSEVPNNQVMVGGAIIFVSVGIESFKTIRK